MLVTCFVLGYCQECNGKCKCHGNVMDCSSAGLKEPFDQMGILPSNISKVELQRNNITSLPTKLLTFVNKDVKELIVAFNEIQRIETKALGKSFPMLFVLELYQNRIRHIHRGDFVALNTLKVLDLGKNQIVTIEKGSFSKMKMLKQLNIDGNQLQSLLPDTFTGLENLQVLKLDSNHLTVLDWKWLHHMTSLEELFVQSNKIRYTQPFDLIWQKSLRKINLSDNQIQYLLNLPTLKNINGVTKAGKDWYMDLSGNPVKCNCFMTSLKYYDWQNLNKAVCGIGMKCHPESIISDSTAQWTIENPCNSSKRMRFVEKYQKMSACQEPHQRLKVSKLDVKEKTFTILQCAASGSIIPNVQIKRLNSDMIVSTQIAKNIAISYLENNESVTNFQCIAENTVGSARSSDWIESKARYSKKPCLEKTNKRPETNEDVTISLVFQFTTFFICTAITLVITVAYIWMLFSRELAEVSINND